MRPNELTLETVNDVKKKKRIAHKDFENRTRKALK